MLHVSSLTVKGERQMTRKDMLEICSQLPYRLMWPDDPRCPCGNSESPVWFNNKGVGYYCCDEPRFYFKLYRISDQKLHEIQEKIRAGHITYDDIDGTSLFEMAYYHEEVDEEDLLTHLSDIVSLRSCTGDYFYCGDEDDGGEHCFVQRFFDSEEEFHKHFVDRSDCYDEWNSFSDEDLERCLKALNYGNIPYDFFTVITKEDVEKATY